MNDWVMDGQTDGWMNRDKLTDGQTDTKKEGKKRKKRKAFSFKNHTLVQ